jgi:formamidase
MRNVGKSTHSPSSTNPGLKLTLPDLTKIHYLSGPFEIENAEPGDVLLVEIMDVQPFQDQPWGFTGVFDKSNGGGFLDEIYPSA